MKLDISSELRGKIWTCFEHSLVHCTDLMKDRHLDQLLLCSIYIISKVSTDRRRSLLSLEMMHHPPPDELLKKDGMS